jgi:hypothetical protein
MGMESNRNQIANAHSHTHCQAAQSNAKTQAWQRVCLSQHTTKTTEKQTDEKKQRRHNITYTQAGGSCFVRQESSKFKVQFFVGKFSGVNPCLRIAENRWVQA